MTLNRPIAWRRRLRAESDGLPYLEPECCGPLSLDALFVETANTAKSRERRSSGIKKSHNQHRRQLPGVLPAPIRCRRSRTPTQPNLANYTQTINNDITTLTNTAEHYNVRRNGYHERCSFAYRKTGRTCGASGRTGSARCAIPAAFHPERPDRPADRRAESCLFSVRAPIDGVVSAVPAVVGEAVPSPAVSYGVPDGELAEVTLNEIDAAKVTLGDKATLSFDAFPDLSLAGQVTELDPVGTVSQGVVNYNAQIAFQANSSRTQAGEARHEHDGEHCDAGRSECYSATECRRHDAGDGRAIA